MSTKDKDALEAQHRALLGGDHELDEEWEKAKEKSAKLAVERIKARARKAAK